MNNKNVKTVMFGLLCIVAIIMVSIVFMWMTTPDEFTWNINITHHSDNNTKHLYDALGDAIYLELLDNGSLDDDVFVFENGSFVKTGDKIK